MVALVLPAGANPQFDQRGLKRSLTPRAPDPISHFSEFIE
jgi:hypothetical protein